MSDTPDIEVKFVDGEPVEAEYFHTTLGLVKFDLHDGVATPRDRWNRLSYDALVDRFDPCVTTGDVYAAVADLPFVDRVEPPESHRSPGVQDV